MLAWSRQLPLCVADVRRLKPRLHCSEPIGHVMIDVTAHRTILLYIAADSMQRHRQTSHHLWKWLMLADLALRMCFGSIFLPVHPDRYWLIGLIRLGLLLC